MAFRDDREALHQRILALESELEDLREELQRARDALSDKDQEIADIRSGRDEQRQRMERERRARARKQKARQLLPLFLLAGGVLIAVGLFLLGRFPQRDFEVTDVRGLQPEHLPAPATAPSPPPPRTMPEERLAGQVRQVSGDAPVEAGAPCTLRHGPTSTADTLCRVFVQCGERELFAVDDTHGYVPCEKLSDPGYAELDTRTDDGDPRLALDRTGRELVVSAEDWQVTISLTP